MSMITHGVSSNCVFGDVSRVVPDNFRLGSGSVIVSVTMILTTVAMTVAVAMSTQHTQLNEVEEKSSD